MTKKASRQFLKVFTFLGVFGLISQILAVPVLAAGEPKKLSEIITILQNIIKLLAPAAGLAFFIMILVGGFQFLNSGGDPKAAGQAKNTLTYAVLGIILVVASWLILKLIGQITGASVTTVNLPGVQ